MNRARLQQSDISRLRDFGLRALSRRGPLAQQEEQAVRAGLMEMQAASNGSELLAEGTRLNRAQILLEGWAIRQRVLSDGRRQIFSFLLPGDIFGICPRSDGEALHATVALTPTVTAPLAILDDALQRAATSACGRIVREMLSLEEALLVNQVVRLGRQSAQERLINLLLEFHDRLAAAGLVEDGSFMLPFTQEVLSDALGLSTVHTNRTLQQLRRENLIETHLSQMRLLDRERLVEIADYRMAPCLGSIAGSFERTNSSMSP
jgi:CRP-like cAMP-binding protein